MGAFAVAQHGRKPDFSFVPEAEDENMLSVVSSFHEHHLDRIVRALDLLPVDPDDRRRRTQTVRGDDGMTVQERYIAAQKALAREFPRKVASLSDAAKEELKRREEEVDGKTTANALGPTEQAYVEARDRLMRAGGAPYDDEDSTYELRNVDIDLPTFPEHPADWKPCYSLSEKEYAAEGTRIIEEGYWLYDFRIILPWPESVKLALQNLNEHQDEQ
ncbi:hypothetical protein LTR78_003871 [Recurvomyces mirabilis]|uniref:Uncharacterized protein n=1 Tax=Recurvomyces mirabilis TaxID=574656 RepID=A0AAE1C2X8_9PEZI|nr:hypothetical protein LTR78_003871 [Recurvomyces mirabilis]KAK5153990.1 hypothetical protein LTS14_007210 [Recurvomyces mirabilis]